MTEKKLRIGFIPLCDATALLVAVDKGFAAAEGLDVELVREFFQALVNHAGITLHIDCLRGINARVVQGGTICAGDRVVRLAAGGQAHHRLRHGDARDRNGPHEIERIELRLAGERRAFDLHQHVDRHTFRMHRQARQGRDQAGAVLGALARPLVRDKGMSVKDLIEFLLLSRQNLTAVLDRLESAGQLCLRYSSGTCHNGSVRDVAIVGIHNTRQAKVLEGHDSRSITLEAALGAIADAGLHPRDIDGVVPYFPGGGIAEDFIANLGLPDLTNRASAFIYGCWQDAKHIADHIVIQRNYDAYTRA